MRAKLLQLINQEAENAKAGLPSGICIKINSLEDRDTIGRFTMRLSRCSCKTHSKRNVLPAAG